MKSIIRAGLYFSLKKDYILRILKIALSSSVENRLLVLGRVHLSGIVALFGTKHLGVIGVCMAMGMD